MGRLKDEQGAIGAWLLAEMESERRWAELLAQSSSVVERMAEDALREHAEGLTRPLDPDRL